MTRSLLNVPLLAAAAGCLWAADAQRGAIVLDNAGCLECHTVHGQGAGHEPSGTAPELGANLAQTYTVPALASAVWNHTPSMLADMPRQRVDRPQLTAADWEDLFAYLYSVQFLDFPAEATRGKEAFLTKQCAGCHSLTNPELGAGKPVADWQPVDDPVTLIYQMWSHSAPMDAAGREAAWTTPGWTKMTGRDFMDLAAYLQQVQKVPRRSDSALPDPAAGKPAFDQNCGSCHAGPLALETLLANATWVDIGAGMWNHVPLMRRVPSITEDDMRKILAYVWDLQYRGPQGGQQHGRQTFSEKGCASCHDGRAIGKTVTPASIAAIGWGEGRRMHQRMLQQGVAWPNLLPQDVADLVAYINSAPAK